MRPPYWRLITSIKIIKKKIIKNYLTFFVGTLGGSLKKIAKKIIPYLRGAERRYGVEKNSSDLSSQFRPNSHSPKQVHTGPNRFVEANFFCNNFYVGDYISSSLSHGNRHFADRRQGPLVTPTAAITIPIPDSSLKLKLEELNPQNNNSRVVES